MIIIIIIIIITAGAAAEGAAERKKLKYQSPAHTHTFISLAFETLGPAKGSAFLIQLVDASQLVLAICEKLLFIFQRLSLTIQRYNAICFNSSFCSSNVDFDS